MRTLPPLAALILLAALLSGCGESSVKRSVDAQTEALRFFAADVPRVAILATDNEAGISDAAIASLSGLAPWGGVWKRTDELLRSSGIPPARLDELIRGSEATAGLPGSQLAMELSGPDQSLTVLVTDRSEEMDKVFRHAAAAGGLTRSGEFDNAAIYKGRGGAFAVRDGVMLVAASTARLRTAIETRDGDRGDQLDDRNVQALLDEVPEQAPLDVYAKPAAERPGPVGEAVFAVNGGPHALRVDAFGHLTGEGEDTTLPLWGYVTRAPARQTRVRVDGDEIRAVLVAQR
jgi:hypothetical protein